MAVTYACPKCGVRIELASSVSAVKCPSCRTLMAAADADAMDTAAIQVASNVSAAAAIHGANETASLTPEQVAAAAGGAAPAAHTPRIRTRKLKVARPVGDISGPRTAPPPQAVPLATPQPPQDLAGAAVARQLEELTHARREQAEREAELILERARIEAAKETQELRERVTAEARQKALEQARKEAEAILDNARRQAAEEAQAARKDAEEQIVAAADGLAQEAREKAEKIEREARERAEILHREGEAAAEEAKNAVIKEAKRLAAQVRKEAENEVAKLRAEATTALESEAKTMAEQARKAAEEEMARRRKAAEKAVLAEAEKLVAETRKRAAEELAKRREEAEEALQIEAEKLVAEARKKARAEADAILDAARAKAASLHKQTPTEDEDKNEAKAAGESVVPEKKQEEAADATVRTPESSTDTAPTDSASDQPSPSRGKRTGKTGLSRTADGRPRMKANGAEIAARKAEIAAAARKEARIITLAASVSAVLGLYFIYVLARLQPPVPGKVFTWLLLVVDAVAIGLVMRRILFHYREGKAAAIRHRERTEAVKQKRVAGASTSDGESKTKSSGAPAGAPSRADLAKSAALARRRRQTGPGSKTKTVKPSAVKKTTGKKVSGKNTPDKKAPSGAGPADKPPSDDEKVERRATENGGGSSKTEKSAPDAAPAPKTDDSRETEVREETSQVDRDAAKSDRGNT